VYSLKVVQGYGFGDCCRLIASFNLKGDFRYHLNASLDVLDFLQYDLHSQIGANMHRGDEAKLDG